MRPVNTPPLPTRRPVRTLLTMILLTAVFALAYAAEEALSEEFLEYINEYSDDEGDLMDPADLANLDAKQIDSDEEPLPKKQDAAP